MPCTDVGGRNETEEERLEREIQESQAELNEIRSKKSTAKRFSTQLTSSLSNFSYRGKRKVVFVTCEDDGDGNDVINLGSVTHAEMVSKVKSWILSCDRFPRTMLFDLHRQEEADIWWLLSWHEH